MDTTYGRVLLLPLNATGEICVQYHLSELYSNGYGSNIKFQPEVEQIIDTNFSGGVLFTAVQAGPHFRISSEPSSFPSGSPNSPLSVTAIFTISSTSPLPKGFYNIEGIGCGYFPLAVGYDASQINSSDFPFTFYPWFGICSLGADVTGLGGSVSYTYINSTVS
jgi:hypothetical protein